MFTLEELKKTVEMMEEPFKETVDFFRIFKDSFYTGGIVHSDHGSNIPMAKVMKGELIIAIPPKVQSQKEDVSTESHRNYTRVVDSD